MPSNIVIVRLTSTPNSRCEFLLAHELRICFHQGPQDLQGLRCRSNPLARRQQNWAILKKLKLSEAIDSLELGNTFMVLSEFFQAA